MRVAALYDVHGNMPALAAVLAQLERERPEAVVVGGDVALGPMPAACLEALSALGPALYVVRGNADREVLAPPAGDDVWAERARFARDHLHEGGRAALEHAAPTVALEVSGLGAVLFCHGSPRSDEEIVTALSPDERVEPMLEGVVEHVVVCGHTHSQFDRRVAGRRIVNAGSVGMPYEDAPGAYWAMLGPDVELRRSSYDLEAAAEQIRATGYPDADELVADLASPTPPGEAAAFFERLAGDG